MSEDHASPADSSGGISDDVRRAARGSVALAIGQILSRGLQLVFVLAVARLVLPEEFGRYSLATALLVFGGFVADFGTTQLIVKTVSRDPAAADDLLSGTLIASVVLGLAGWAGITAVAALLYEATVTFDVMIIGASLPLSAVTTSLLGACDGIGRFGVRTTATTVQTIIASLGGAVAVWIAGDVRAAMALVPAGVAAALIVSAWAVRRARLLTSPVRIDLAQASWLLKRSMPFAMFAGLGAISGRFDVVLLSWVDTKAVTAQYDVALRAVEALWYFQSLLTAPALFLLSRRIAAHDVRGTQRAYGEAVRLSYLVGLLMSALLVGLHEQVAHMLGGGDYPRTGTALALMGLGMWLSFVGLAQGALLMASDRLRTGLCFAGGVTAATIALDVVLIPSFGLVGASLAATMTAGITVAGFSCFAWRAEGLSTPTPDVRSVVAAAGAGALAWGLRQQPAAAAVAGVTVYCAVLALTGVVHRTDVERFRRALSRQP